MDHEKVIVIDFGGQYNQLVARRVRECNVYCEIYSYKTDIAQIKAMNPKGIILTGGPNSCYEADSPTCSKELFELGVPVLGLCYGAQLMMHVLGGKVEKAPVREYGKTEVISIIFHRLHRDLTSLHIRRIVRLPQQRTRRKDYLQSSSTRKCFTHRKAQRCFTTLYAASAVVREPGEWILLLRIR